MRFVSLRKWLHHRGCPSTSLQPATFSDTGRGLMSLQNVLPGEVLISLPESCLLSTSTVLDSYLGEYIKRWQPPLSPLLALCVFLICEQHRGEDSDWFPYINILPTSYTCPAYYPDEVLAVLPVSVRGRALEQRERVMELHTSSVPFFRSLQPILSQPAEEVLTYEALRWAWCSVNTRSVFLSRPQTHPFLSGQDVCALAPYLDLLNHRPDLQVSACFSHVTGCYEIRCSSTTQKYQQAFINYGSHDNQRLLLEYGFVAPGNPHSVVYLDTEQLTGLSQCLAGSDRSLEQKIRFLQNNSFSHDLTVTSDGPSWRLMTALRLLSLPQHQYPQWRKVLLGAAVDEERERWCIQTAVTLCLHALEDTHSALDTISRLAQRSDQPVREQLGVVKGLREEERCILGHCLQVLQVTMRQACP
ncbi:SET domain-containing protein 4 [Aplochiton taeniatus]